MHQLDRQRALEMVSAVVDGEAPPTKQLAFMAFIRKDPEVRREYEIQRKMKRAVQTHCKKVNAPEHLRERIFRLLESEATS